VSIRLNSNDRKVYYTVPDDQSSNKIEEELRKTNQRLLDIIEFLPDATFVIDQEQKVVAWNRAIEEMTGVKKENIIGKGDYSYAQYFYSKPKPMLINMAGTLLESVGETADYRYIERRGDTLYGEVFVPKIYGGKGAFLWVKASPLFDKSGNWVGAIETLRDLTERKQMEERVNYLDLHDPLTGLYNRAFFKQEISRLSKDINIFPIGLILCDIDGFKAINVTLGHDTGDTFLIETANIIIKNILKSNIAARIGGDEFAVLLPQSGQNEVKFIVDQIRNAVANFYSGYPEFPLSVSIGYSINNQPQIDMGVMFKEADDNMNREKLYHRQSLRSNIVQTLLATLRERDLDTEGHANRLQEIVILLGKENNLSERTLTDLRLLAQFHDIGKIGIPDRILLKKGPFTEKELLEMHKHCEIGFRIAKASSELSPIADKILKHHEWWNGQGYPLGLKGEEIPLECRILAIADAYDAMTNDRPYRKAMSKAEAFKEISKWAGKQFAPELVEKFLTIMV
jgi:diguanylate cyclase (GGDEF)-like protein/PAS domain S-box-containing protein